MVSILGILNGILISFETDFCLQVKKQIHKIVKKNIFFIRGEILMTNERF